MIFKKHSHIIIALALVSMLLIFGACSDDDNGTNNNTDVAGEIVINATSMTEWVYFSFDTEDTFRLADSYNSANWDIGFQRYHLCTNSGSSGMGQGGAADMGKVGFESVTQAPASGYTVDDSLEILRMGGSINISANHLLETWGALDTTSMPPVFVPSDKIFVVRTADGKYAKVWLKSYYKNDGSSAHITMKYKYQADGSTNLND